MEKTATPNVFKKVIILAGILILPGFLYYLLEKKGENRYTVLPIYGEKTLTGTFTSRMGEQIPDTLYHEISPFTLTNELGEPVHVLAADTTLSVVCFFYTRCSSTCRHMNDEMNRVADRFKQNDLVRFYSVSVDTAFDSPEVLQEYANAYTPKEKKWDFLTSGKDDVYQIAREGFLVDAVQDTTQEEVAFFHSMSLVLVDTHRRIRGYYDANDKSAVDRLIDEINLLLVQEIRERSPLQ